MSCFSCLPVTVAIPVKNEEANLAACLERLDGFAEVVVIDSGSTDGTREIAHNFGARVVDFQWDGAYPKKRNWFLLNHPPTQPWILFLDADEILNEDFCRALEAAVRSEEFNGYWLTYSNYFLGRRLRHGVTQRKLALFRVGNGLYQRVEETGWSGLDMEIHEHPIVDGRVGEIPAPIEHRDDRGLAKFISKHRDYALWEAKRFISIRCDPEAQFSLTKRQRFKYRYLARWWYPWLYFLTTYVAKLGFLDKAHGFYYAFFKVWYFQTIALLIREEAEQ